MDDYSSYNGRRRWNAGRCRLEDALRRLFSDRPSPEAKAAIAKRFKALRRKARMTQANLGDIIGICRQAVNEIENRRVYPHYTTIARFSDLEAKHERKRRITASVRNPFWSKTSRDVEKTARISASAPKATALEARHKQPRITLPVHWQ